MQILDLQIQRDRKKNHCGFLQIPLKENIEISHVEKARDVIHR